MLIDMLYILAIPIEVAKSGSIPWLLAMLVALNLGTAVVAARVLIHTFVQRRRIAEVRILLERRNRRR